MLKAISILAVMSFLAVGSVATAEACRGGRYNAGAPRQGAYPCPCAYGDCPYYDGTYGNGNPQGNYGQGGYYHQIGGYHQMGRGYRR